jgi:predicted amidophosphoribosyltransferase
VSNVLAPARSYRPLKDLSREERHAAVAGAFEVRRGATLRGRPVIVVDDVITTGATTGEAIRSLEASRLPVHGVAAVTAASRDTWARIRAPAPTTYRS